MSYDCNNQRRLDTLFVKGNNDILSFETNSEKASIYIKDNDIEKVIYKENDVETVVTKADRYHIVVGKDNVQRDVFHYLKPGGPASQMRLGITKHIGKGTWSSQPHDFELNTEPGFEEVFFYMLEGATQTAIQRGKGVWSNNELVDDAWLVKDRSFSTIPMGYHPVVGEPNVHVSYIWVYLCKKPEWEKI